MSATPTPRATPAPAATAKPEIPWVRTGSDDGIVTFKRDVPGSDVVALRGVGVVNATIVRVASVLLDYERAPEWVDSLDEARVVRMLPAGEFIEYDHVNTPPIIMADRDFVCRGRIVVDARQPQPSLTLSLWPATDRAVPPVPRYVRGTLSGYWKLVSIDHGLKTHVTTEMHGDPKGGVAKWIVNFFQSGWPHNTLESLREQVAKRDVRIIPQVQALFDGKPLELPVRRRTPNARADDE